MQKRLPIVLSVMALVVSLLGTTPLGHAASAVATALFAKNAGKVNGISAARTPTAGKLVPLDSSAKLPASVLPAGFDGAQGAAGPAGEQGPAGPAGAAGAAGPKGDAGETGAKGDKGHTGDKGDTGAAGAQGLRGDAGEAGPAGPQGPAGPAGAQGSKGDAGPAGPEGPAGPAGPEGPAGPAGPQGPEGRPGPAGPVNVVVRTAAFTSVTTAQVSCNAGERALAGGHEYTGSTRLLTSSPVPNTAGATPTGWKIVLSGSTSGTLYVICVA